MKHKKRIQKLRINIEQSLKQSLKQSHDLQTALEYAVHGSDHHAKLLSDYTLLHIHITGMEQALHLLESKE